MKGKMKLLVPLIVLIAMGAGYKLALAKPAPKTKPHVDGNVYVLGKEFLVNLADGRFAKLTAALILSHKDTSTAAAGHAAPTKVPEGFGAMGQEAVVRSIITDSLTGTKDVQLEEPAKRDKLRAAIVARIGKETDVKAEDLVFTDLTVQ
jgi:flagellar FliL protein